MRNTTPFFAGFHRLLFGRAQRCAQQQLLAQRQALEQATLSQLGKACAPWVPARLLKPAALNAAHDRPREQTRLFNQLLQILAEDIVPFRPERAEPRVRKRRPKAYPLMTQPRRQYHLAWTS